LSYERACREVEGKNYKLGENVYKPYLVTVRCPAVTEWLNKPWHSKILLNNKRNKLYTQGINLIHTSTVSTSREVDFTKPIPKDIYSIYLYNNTEMTKLQK
jgi:hypothetical protein